MPDRGKDTGRTVVGNVMGRLDQNEREVKALKGGRRASVDRGVTTAVPSPVEGQTMIQGTDLWYYAEGAWHMAGGCCNHGVVITDDSAGTKIMYATDFDGVPQFNFKHVDLIHPIDIAFDTWNNIYVVNNAPGTTKYPVFKFNSAGSFIAGLGTVGNGSANGQCSGPTGICTDASDNLYIVDAGNDRIQKWDSDGNYISKWGTTGSGNNQFNFSTGNYQYICCDGTYLYVTDNGNDRVKKMTLSGVYVGEWGTAGTGDGQFTLANGIDVGPGGDIYVVDDQAGSGSRLQKFDNTGSFLSKTTFAFGSGDGEMSGPNAVGIDEDGNIYVADEGNLRVQKFDPAGAFVAKFAELPGNPQGIAVRPGAV